MNTKLYVSFMKPTGEAPDRANVMAVFLNVMFSNDQTLRMSYAQEGQHSSCGDVYEMFTNEHDDWEPVPSHVFEDCLTELKGLGYEVTLVNPDNSDAVEFHLLNAK